MVAVVGYWVTLSNFSLIPSIVGATARVRSAFNMHVPVPGGAWLHPFYSRHELILIPSKPAHDSLTDLECRNGRDHCIDIWSIQCTVTGQLSGAYDVLHASSILLHTLVLWRFLRTDNGLMALL